MRDLLRSDAVISLPTMFAGQLVLTMAAYTLPVVAPAALPDMGIPAVFVGFFTSAVYLVAMAAGLFTGPLLSRLGTVRTMQCLLLAATAGVALFDLGWWMTAALAAMAIGMGSGPMNPSGSYILARTTPPHWRAFVFSVKQCATPAGGMLAGVVVPAVLLRHGWQAAVGTVGLFALAVILAIQPARKRLDAERPPLRRVSAASVIEPIKLMMQRRDLRAISVMAFIFSSAVPLPPAMIAPAWPMRRPGGAVCPAMKPTTGFFTCAFTYSAASSSADPPISPIITMARVCLSSPNSFSASVWVVPTTGSPPMPMHVDCPMPSAVSWATAS